MKLKSFEIRSYRSCIKVKFPLHPELTGLIGINGAGKSNILNALLLLRRICEPRYIIGKDINLSYNESYVSIELEHENKVILMKGEIIFNTGERNIDEVLHVKNKWRIPGQDDKNIWISTPIEFFSISEPYAMQHRFFKSSLSNSKNYYNIYKNVNIINNNKKILSEIHKFLNGISYYSASQFSDPSRCPVSIELDDQRPIKRSRSIAGHDQFMLDLYKLWKSQDKSYNRYLTTVNQEGIGLVDDITFQEVSMPSSVYKVESAGKIQKIERNRLLIIPSFVVDGNILSPNQLSEGTFKTLALLFYVLTDESDLLLIEEPEVCIHHGLLDSVISLIKNYSKEKQIIISTHSDFVLDKLNPENLLLIKRDKNSGTQAQPLRKSMTANDYKALHTYLKTNGNLGEYWRDGGFDNE